MIWIGLDVHKGYSRMGMFDPASGAIQDLGTVRNEPSMLEETLSELASPKTVVLEAGRSSHYMAGVLEAMAEQVWIVDPGEVRRLQRTIAKTDRRDAAALAWWAGKGVLTPQWRPDAALLDLRELTRGKTVLTRLSTQVRTMMRMLLARHGWECPHRDLLGERGQVWLDEVELEGHAGRMLAALREILVVIQAKADAFECLVERESSTHPVAQRLRTIPGIGPFLSLALAAEIGDINRFPSPPHLRGYSGLVPAVHQSGQKDTRGPLTKVGNAWLRYAAVLATQRMAQMRHPDPKLKHVFLSVAFRHGRNPGKIAAARRLLDLIYHLLKAEEDYQPPIPRMARVN
ncbi:MAG: IS110 family transposase [Armatimonadota bacterium]